jgi:hypothetical protein
LIHEEAKDDIIISGMALGLIHSRVAELPPGCDLALSMSVLMSDGDNIFVYSNYSKRWGQIFHPCKEHFKIITKKPANHDLCMIKSI